MADRVSIATRHRIMASNQGKNTGPEIEVRKALSLQGFRYRLNVGRLPGKPDIVLRPRSVAIFVHGCYWHGHQCRRKPSAKSNKRFWRDKVRRNRKRDISARRDLLENGWRVLVIWECAVRRRSPPLAQSDDIRKVAAWIRRGGRLAILAEGGFEECL
jgi:DNA mismatch endonuclease (patch repair protein)